MLDKYKHIGTFDFDAQKWEVRVFASKSDNIPAVLYYKTSLGKLKPIAVKIVMSGPVVAHAATVISPADTISNKEIGSRFGSIGCVVRDEDSRLCLLTCYHAVKTEKLDWNGIAQGSAHLEVASKPNGKTIGKIIQGFRDDELDVAIVLPDQGIQLSTKFPKDPDFFNGKSRAVVGKDFVAQTQVNLKSAVQSKIASGKITHINRPVNIEYPDRSYKIINLLEIRSDSTEPFSVEGDSGGLVVDNQGYAIGLLVAGNTSEKISFAIPISKIENRLKIKLV